MEIYRNKRSDIEPQELLVASAPLDDFPLRTSLVLLKYYKVQPEISLCALRIQH